jgi:hypothetical protein
MNELGNGREHISGASCVIILSLTFVNGASEVDLVLGQWTWCLAHV